MANYNPHLPTILGNEFAPIRNEDILYTGVVNNIERGYSFKTTGSRTLTTGQFYMNDFPSAYTASNVYTINVYPKDNEDHSGPINSVVIPCNNGGISGNGASFFDATTVAEALKDPSAGSDINVQFGTSTGAQISMFFAVNQYANILNGKRILGVNFLYAADQITTGDLTDTTAQSCSLQVYLRHDAFIGTWQYPDLFGGTALATFRNQGNRFIPNEINRIALGDTNMFFNGTGNGVSLSSCMPWTYTDLLKFEATFAGTRLFMWGTTNGFFSTVAPLWGLTYAALEVIYCEEQRVACGSGLFTASGQASTSTNFNLGTNLINMRTFNGSLNPVLAANTDYTVTLMRSNVGDQILAGGGLTASVTTGPEASLNALREYYPMTNLPAIEVDIPAPPTPDIDGQVFTKQTTAIIPQVTLNTSGGPLSEVHVYGRQAVAQVYGAVTATQRLEDSTIANGNTRFPQVRFYARRFGVTTVSLTLEQVFIVGPTVSITPADFDLLPTIIDGWKEVTLTFANAVVPVMGAGSFPTWRWQATGEVAGNRWEILGAVAPALSGVPGNDLNLAPTAQVLSGSTYGAPVSGAAMLLSWVPGYAPPVSGTTADGTSDAVILFSQDPPAVSGFTLTPSTQTLTGIGLNCGLNPGFIPTAITYNRLTWTQLSSTSIAATGFGSYEIQRMDTIDTDWQTIMLATSITASGFNDYEARVGILSSYRIRCNNYYNFHGPWSSTLTSTITSPGVSGTSIDGTTHILAFTTNSQQSGASNLAYALGWEGEVSEDFNFPESGGQVYQAMYNRDFITVFRPLERGGTNFTRTLLVQAAAIAVPTLEDFVSLRDMAWASVPFICVRDEAGNRWFANVSVPSGTVQRGRRLYMAPINVVQVTDTPTPVNP